MAPELVAPLRHRVFRRVENRLVVVRPDDRSGALDGLGQCFARPQVLHVQGVLAIAGRVRRIRQQVPVVAHRIPAEPEKRVPFGERVEIEQNLLRPLHAPLPAALVGILLPLLRARVIPVVAETIRHAQVGLLDAAEHLRVQRVLEFLRRRHHGVGVGILGFQVRDDLRVGFLAQPEVVVFQSQAVDLRFVRHFLRDGRLCRGPGLGDQRGGQRENRGEECGEGVSAAVHGV